MSRARLLVILLCVRHGGLRNYGVAGVAWEAGGEDPVVLKLRSQLMNNNYDYEESESLEKALRVGGSRDLTMRTQGKDESHVVDPQVKVISDESELSNFEMDRNVLNGYITDMSELNDKNFVPRADVDTISRGPALTDAVNELSDQPDQLTELEPDEQPGALSPDPPEQQPSPVKQPKPVVKHSRPEPAPVMRAQLDPVELSQPEQVEEFSQGEGQRRPQLGAGGGQRQMHVVSAYLAGDYTTEAVPYKVLMGRGQRHGRRSGAGAASYLQTQLNGSVVVAPLAPGPLPDFQLPRDRRQYREISDDEDQKDEVADHRERLAAGRRAA